jgi:hypothetical protein
MVECVGNDAQISRGHCALDRLLRHIESRRDFPLTQGHLAQSSKGLRHERWIADRPPSFKRLPELRLSHRVVTLLNTHVGHGHKGSGAKVTKRSIFGLGQHHFERLNPLALASEPEIQESYPDSQRLVDAGWIRGEVSHGCSEIVEFQFNTIKPLSPLCPKSESLSAQ